MVPTLLANTIDRIFEPAVRVSAMVAAMLISNSWVKSQRNNSSQEEAFPTEWMQAVCRDFPGDQRRFDPRDLAGDQFRCSECLKIPHGSGKNSADLKAGRSSLARKSGPPGGGRFLAAGADC
jgi:hypothetical protein